MKKNLIILIAILLAIAIIGTAIYMLTKGPSQSKSSSKTSQTNTQNNLAASQPKLPVQDDALDANYETSGKWYGLCPKNSIHSVEDFRKMVDSDPVLKAHFANFNWANARMGRLDNVTRAYVHYRKGNAIFQKKTPIVLPAGDGYVTDGEMLVRTNCCNSYHPVNELDIDPAAGPSQLPQLPMPLAMETVPLPPVPGQPATAENPVVPVTTAGGNSPIPIPMPPPVNPPPGYDPPETKPTDNPPPPPVPIPAAVWLLGSGLVFLIGFRRKYKK